MCGTIPPPPANANTTPPPPTAGHVHPRALRAALAGHDVRRLPRDDGSDRARVRDTSTASARTGRRTGSAPWTRPARSSAAGPIWPGRSTARSSWRTSSPNRRTVANCIANQWFRFSLGRMETTNDACSIQGIRDSVPRLGRQHSRAVGAHRAQPAFRNVRLTPGAADHHGA